MGAARFLPQEPVLDSEGVLTKRYAHDKGRLQRSEPGWVIAKGTHGL